MKPSIIILTILSIALNSCSNPPTQRRPIKAAVDLNNKAIALIDYVKIPDSNQKAVRLLDSATTIDSSYYLGYYNKLIFLNQSNQPEKSLFTINRLIKLKPFAHEFYMYAGMMYEKKGDSINAEINYKKSLTICNRVLDTMKTKNQDYFLFTIDKAVNLILTGKNREGNILLAKLREMEPIENKRKVIEGLMNKDKAELFKQLAGEPHNQ